MSIFLFDGEYNEQRHEYDRQAQDISGRIVGIEWCPDIIRTEAGMQISVGHGSGVSIVSTDDLTFHLPKGNAGAWSLRFTVETDDPLPVVDAGREAGTVMPVDGS